jgi:flagellar biosynthesis/type III secretory pathway protein FliH
VYSQGHKRGHEGFEEAVAGALEEGKAEGYSLGLADGRRWGREEAGVREDERVGDMRAVIAVLHETIKALPEPKGARGSTLQAVIDVLQIVLDQPQPTNAELEIIYRAAKQARGDLFDRSALTFNIAISRSLERAFWLWGKL